MSSNLLTRLFCAAEALLCSAWSFVLEAPSAGRDTPESSEGSWLGMLAPASLPLEVLAVAGPGKG